MLGSAAVPAAIEMYSHRTDPVIARPSDIAAINKGPAMRANTVSRRPLLIRLLGGDGGRGV